MMGLGVSDLTSHLNQGGSGTLIHLNFTTTSTFSSCQATCLGGDPHTRVDPLGGWGFLLREGWMKWVKFINGKLTMQLETYGNWMMSIFGRISFVGLRGKITGLICKTWKK